MREEDIFVRFIDDIYQKSNSGIALRPRLFIPICECPFLSSLFYLPENTKIRLSAETILRHKEKDAARKTSVKDYARLLAQPSAAKIYRDSKSRHCAIIQDGDIFWQIGLKRTSKDEIYITTLHRIKERQINKLTCL